MNYSDKGMQWKQTRETRKFLCTPVTQVETTDKTSLLT